MDPKFFKKKKVLITGHTGFVGSWLTLWLHELGAEITGISLDPPSNPYHYDFLNLKNKINDMRTDVNNAPRIKSIVNDFKPEIIFHLAAQPILLRSYEDPVKTYATNITGTVNVLEALSKEGSAKAFVNITSDKVYANVSKKVYYKEDSKLGGKDPYSSSKACSEIITSSYRSSFLSDIGVATARAGNILGGGDWGAYRIVPNLVVSYINKKTLYLRNPNSIRPWTNILDILNGYLILAERLYRYPKKYSSPWNFSTDYVKKVIDLVNELRKYYPVDYKIKKIKMHEEKILLLDSTKSRKELGWKPLFRFEESVEDTALWYKYFYANKGRNIYEYSKSQLAKFEREARG